MYFGLIFLDVVQEVPREFYYVNYEDTLQYAVDILSGVAVRGFTPHRIGVFDSQDGQLTSVVTQSRIVKYLYESLYAFNIGNMAIDQIGVGTMNVYTVKQNHTVRSAMVRVFSFYLKVDPSLLKKK